MDRGLHHAHRGTPARADPVAPVTGGQRDVDGAIGDPGSGLAVARVGLRGHHPAYVTPALEAQPARDGRIDERVTAVEQRMHEMSPRLDKVGGDAAQTALVGVVRRLARIQAASLGPISGTDVPDAKKRRVTLRLMVDKE